MSSCAIFLTGIISKMPTHETDALSLRHHGECRSIAEYRVFLRYGDLKKIMRSGRVGALLSVQGKLRVGDLSEILADKVRLVEEGASHRQSSISSFGFRPTVNSDTLFSETKRDWFAQLH